MRARVECKECGGIQDATFVDNNPVYVCRCCGEVTERKVYNTKKKEAKAAKQDEFANMIEDLLK